MLHTDIADLAAIDDPRPNERPMRRRVALAFTVPPGIITLEVVLQGFLFAVFYVWGRRYDRDPRNCR